MAVNQRRAVLSGDFSHLHPDHRMESCAAFERDHRNAVLSEPAGPRPRIVEAADNRGDVRRRAAADLDDELLGPPWIQAEHDVQHRSTSCRRYHRRDVEMSRYS